MIRKELSKKYRLHQSYNAIPLLEELEKNQYLKLDEIKVLQKGKLKNILKIAVENVPYYEFLKKESDLIFSDNMTTKQMLDKFPILTKQNLIEKYDDLINPNCKNKIFKNYSGGSTGKPVKLLQDSVMRDFGLAATIRSDRWAGWEFGSSVFKFWGASRDQSADLKEKAKRFLFNEYVFDAFGWNENTIRTVYKLMKKEKPEIIIAYASAVYFYVDTVKKMGLKSNHTPKGIITSADMLYDWQRKEIEEYFNCKIFNRYGCREVGLIACECEEHDGMHISSDRIYLEVVDDNNQPVPDGCSGRILITDLTNTAMPIIRYEIGDIGAISENHICKCGRGLPKLKYIEGRVTDYLVDTDGKYISGTALTTVVPQLNNVQQIQIIQKEKGKVLAKIVKESNYSKNDELHVETVLKKYLGINMVVEFEYVPSLLNVKSGKYRFVINEM